MIVTRSPGSILRAPGSVTSLTHRPSGGQAWGGRRGCHGAGKKDSSWFTHPPSNPSQLCPVLGPGWDWPSLSPNCSHGGGRPSWTQPRGQGATEGSLSLPREAKRASSCILLLLHTQARHIHRQAPLGSFRFFPAPVSQPSSRPLHLSSASQLFSPTLASHLQYHPSNPFLHQAGVIQCVKSCSFPARSSFTTS